MGFEEAKSYISKWDLTQLRAGQNCAKNNGKFTYLNTLNRHIIRTHVRKMGSKTKKAHNDENEINRYISTIIGLEKIENKLLLKVFNETGIKHI